MLIFGGVLSGWKKLHMHSFVPIFSQRGLTCCSHKRAKRNRKIDGDFTAGTFPMIMNHVLKFLGDLKFQLFG